MQSQLHLQTLVSTTFSCITYLRNIFSEECYETIYIQNIPLKRIKKNEKTSLLLSLLERGIYETIMLKYLRSFTVGIYTNIDTPNTLVESYTFDIRYTQQDDKSFIQNIKKFCLVLQKLNPLPVKKYLTVKLIYTSDTPDEYQPYGFKDGNGIIYEYNGTNNIKFDFERSSGVVPSSIQIEKKLIKDRVNENKVNEDKVNENIDVKKDITANDVIKVDDVYNENIDVKDNIKENIEVKEDKVKDNIKENIEIKEDKAKDNIKENITANINENKIDSIRCTCLINANHFDMIYCDTCTNWLHTVCCGYFSNNDKRIPKSEYKCAFCYGEMNQNLSEISLIRRLLSVLYNEEYKSKESLAKRMGLKYDKLNKLFNRIASEGFIKIHSKKRFIKFSVIKDEYTKSKLKKYFRVGKSSVPIEDIKSKLN